MKKYLLLFVFCFGVLALNAQNLTVALPAGQTYKAITSTYNITDATAGYTLFNASQNQPSTQDFQCHLDSVSGNHTYVSVALWGRKFDTSAWVAIGSAVVWKGTTPSHDTTIVISNATAARYKDLKVSYTGTGTGVTKVTTQKLKLYLE